MSSPARAGALGVALAAALGVGTWLVGGSGYVAGGVPVRSSLRTSPDGVAALSRAIARLGTPAAPRMTPFADADSLRGTLVALEVDDPISPREAGALLGWVRAGGVLLYAPALPRSGLRLGGGSSSVQPLLLDSLGLAAQPAAAGGLARGPPPDRLAARWAPHPLTAGLASPGQVRYVVVEDSPTREAPTLSVDTLLAAPGADQEGWAAAVVALGRGRIVLFASAEPLANGRAAEAPLAHLAIRAAVAYTSPPDTVFFDEFHHGVHGLGSPLDAASGFALGTPAGRAVLHGAVVLVVALAFAGIRLGAPRDPRPQERRSPLEHASALASLYERAGARNTAAALLAARLAREAGLPAPRDPDEAAALLANLERRRGPSAALDRIGRGLRASPPDLVAVAGGIDQYSETNARR